MTLCQSASLSARLNVAPGSETPAKCETAAAWISCLIVPPLGKKHSETYFPPRASVRCLNRSGRLRRGDLCCTSYGSWISTAGEQPPARVSLSQHHETSRFIGWRQFPVCFLFCVWRGTLPAIFFSLLSELNKSSK